MTFVRPVGGRNAFVSALFVGANAMGPTGEPAAMFVRKRFVLPATILVPWTTFVTNKTRFVSEMFVLPSGPRKMKPGVE